MIRYSLEIYFFKSILIHLPLILFILKFTNIFHFKVLHHLCPFICKFNGYRNWNDTGLTLLTVTKLKCDFVDRFLTKSIVLHLIQHNFALLGDDVFRLAPQCGENLEVVFLLGDSYFIYDTAWQHGFAQTK